MTEDEWLASTDPEPMLFHCAGIASDRKLRLFATACCRRIAHVISDENTRMIVDVSEKYADGMNVSLDFEFQNFGFSDFHNYRDNRQVTVIEAIALSAVSCLRHRLKCSDASQDSSFVMGHPELARQNLTKEEQERIVNSRGATVKMATINKARKQELIEQARLIRDIFGNPFRPVTINPSWLTATVIALATSIYSEKAFDRLPILADALQDAGCENDEILNHLRQPGEHCRGCWALDLVLAKE
jgi:hypothetical protein